MVKFRNKTNLYFYLSQSSLEEYYAGKLINKYFTYSQVQVSSYQIW